MLLLLMMLLLLLLPSVLHGRYRMPMMLHLLSSVNWHSLLTSCLKLLDLMLLLLLLNLSLLLLLLL